MQSGQLDERAREFIARAILVAQEHLLRWIKGDRIFQAAGWGCGSSLYDLRAFLQKKLRREFASPKELSYCNAVLDTGLWIIASTAELMAAQLLLDEALRLNERDREELKDYLRAACCGIGVRPNSFAVKMARRFKHCPFFPLTRSGAMNSKAFLSVSNAVEWRRRVRAKYTGLLIGRRVTPLHGRRARFAPPYRRIRPPRSKRRRSLAD